MKRWLFNIAAGASAVMLVAILVAWIWSYSALLVFNLPIQYKSFPARLKIMSGKARVELVEFPNLSDNLQMPIEIPSRNIIYQDIHSFSDLAAPFQNTVFGFGIHRDYTPNSRGPVWVQISVLIPLWAPFILAGILPGSLPTTWLIKRYRRNRRIRYGNCVVCGYALRGTLAAGRRECPECGTEIPPQMRATPT